MIQKICKLLCEIYDDCILVFCFIFILIGGYTCYDSYMLFNNAQDKSLLQYKPEINEDGTPNIDTSSLSEDVIGWLSIDDTSIDYPIMKGNDNNEYLNTDPYGNYSLSGSIFLDSRNASDFSDPYSLIYGHHMSNGYMFGALDSFLSEEYFDEHRTGSLIVTDDGETGELHEFNIIGIMDTVTSDSAFSPGEIVISYDYIQRKSLIYREPTSRGNNILAMSTCKSAETTGRLIVFAEVEPTSAHKTIAEDTMSVTEVNHSVK